MNVKAHELSIVILCDMSLMHLLTIVIFTHSVKIQRIYIFLYQWLAIVKSLRKKDQVRTPIISKRLFFCLNEKV